MADDGDRLEKSATIPELEARWASLGIDPRAVTVGGDGTIVSPPWGEVVVDVAPLPQLSTPGVPEEEGTPELRIGSTLGSGGMGIIRRATQLALGREVVVKVARVGERGAVAAAHVLREARVVGSLEHPNIIPVHMLGRNEQGSPMMVMRRVDGVPWAEVIRDPNHPARPRDGRDLLEFHLQIMLQVCNALEYAHSRGVLHRDIKPDNVMVGAFGQVYLVDWGTAVATREEWAGVLPLAREVNRLDGTPQYMAPEMAGLNPSRIDERTDVYLLGATLHECITGQRRHRAPTIMATLYEAYRSVPFVYDRSVPGELAAICNRATHVDPSRRFASVAEFRSALADFLRHRTSAALCDVARARLDDLQALLRQRGEIEALALDEQTHHQLIECRFAFRQALKEWPENQEAKGGLARALEMMADYQLTQGDHRAAAVLISEIEDPPEALRARLLQLRRREEKEKRKVEQLRHLEWELNPRIGRRERAIFALVLGVLFGGVALVNGYAERHGWWTVGLGARAVEVTVFWVLMLAVIVWARRALPDTRINRFVFGITGVLAAAILALPFGCALLGITARAAMTLELLLIASAIGALSIAVQRQFRIPALIYAVAFFAAAALPQMAFEIRGAAHLVALSHIALAWRRRRPASV